MFISFTILTEVLAEVRDCCYELFLEDLLITPQIGRNTFPGRGKFWLQNLNYIYEEKRSKKKDWKVAKKSKDSHIHCVMVHVAIFLPFVVIPINALFPFTDCITPFFSSSSLVSIISI